MDKYPLSCFSKDTFIEKFTKYNTADLYIIINAANVNCLTEVR
jgi:hypothetical protein